MTATEQLIDAVLTAHPFHAHMRGLALKARAALENPGALQAALKEEQWSKALQAAKLRSELGAYACANFAFGCDLITELYTVMVEALKAQEGEQQGSTEKTVPPDAYWTRLAGGGQSHIYLVRPREARDPKVYGVREL